MQKLIFVYNADSGIANGLLDIGRRYLQPEAYPCALCMITYTAFGMKKDWKKFTQSLPYPVSFLHKDEFSKAYPAVELVAPALYEIDNTDTVALLNGADFKTIDSLDDLKTLVSKVVKN